MRRIITALACLCIALEAFAIPAKPGFRSYTQPNGTTLVLEQRGDEWGSWFVDKSGQKYTMDNRGYFQQISDATVRSISRRSSEMREQANIWRRSIEFTDMTHGTRHIPVILVEFQDVKFKIDNPGLSFNALLNETGYNGYNGAGATGSVRDFYMDNSHGAFEPVFDVFGPVKLDNDISYYGEQVMENGKVKLQDKQPELALYDACLKLDDIVDFSNFDYNNDGFVDMVLFYYAGGSQAEGWPVDHIWPHSWSVQGSSSSEARNHQFDGKKLGNYFCTAELKGTKLVNSMCSIGPTCHEFGHSLGLPDFYDADYEDNGYNEGLYMFSTMCIGPYLDDSRTPPYFNAEERIMLGWMEESDIRPITPGENALPFIDENVALITYATADGEYFLYEKRGGADNKWDKALPAGLVVYHVDKSPDHIIYGGVTAKAIWRTNKINNYGGHPCFRLVPPNDQNATDYSYTQRDFSDLVFPGYYGINNYSAVDWDSNESDIWLSDIQVSGNEVLFTAHSSSMTKYIEGTVVDTSSKPLQGVTVALNAYSDELPAGASGIRIRKLMSEGAQQAVTGADGKFSFEIVAESPVTYTVSVALDGYIGQSATVETVKKINRVDFALRKIGEFGMTGEFAFWDTGSESFFCVGSEGQTSMMIAAKCGRDVWGAYEGLIIKSVTMLTYFDADAYYFILDSQDGISSVKAPSIETEYYTTFDLPNDGLRIPSGDFYIGFAVENKHTNAQYNYPMVAAAGVGCYSSSFKLSAHGSWEVLNDCDVPLKITLYDESYVPDIADMGYPYIDIAPGSFNTGDKINLNLKVAPGVAVTSVSWTFDGKDCSDATAVTLQKSGWHTITATVTYKDGSKEIIEREVEVK